jgi:DNA polymerase-3 subunit alpha
MRILVFDAETTGLAKTKTISKTTIHLWPHAVQTSYLIYDTNTNKLEKTYDAIIKLKPYNVISPESVALHGITNEISESQGIPIINAISELLIDIEAIDIVIMHNVDFDLSVIKIELIRLIESCEHEADLLQFCSTEQLLIHGKLVNMLSKFQALNNVRCTMRESVDFCKIERENSRGKYFKFPTLSELHIKLFNIQPQNLHNSFHDILVTLRCFVQKEYNIDIVEVNPEIKKLLINII